MSIRPLPLLLLCLLLFSGGCTDDDEPTATPEADQEALGRPPASRGADTSVDPVAIDQLRTLLPDTLAGLPRSSAEGDVRSALGVSTATVRARYGSPDSTLALTVTDIGGLSSAVMLGHTWVDEEIDRRWEGGYERTLRLRGYPAYERRESGGTTALYLFVAGRFVVELDGHQVTVPSLRRALRQLPLARLTALGENAG